jgi:hypothetical protein
MNSIDEQIINSITSPYILKRYNAWFHTPLGAVLRWIILMFVGALFTSDARGFFILIGGLAYAGALWIVLAGLCKRVFAFSTFIGIPTVGQVTRSYKKIWPVVKQGPIQTVIKVHPSPPTP